MPPSHSTHIMRELIKNPHFFEGPEGPQGRAHSQTLDSLLGFRTPEIEEGLLKNFKGYHEKSDLKKSRKSFPGGESWIGLHPQIFQTPFGEIFRFFQLLSRIVHFNPQSIVDFGSGYGRIGLVGSAFYPYAHFFGYEIVKERVTESIRIFESLCIKNYSFHTENILSERFQFPKACLYFIYDFSDPQDLKIILNKLSEKLFKEDFYLVAKGKGVRSLIQERYPEFYSCNGVHQEENWALYSSMHELD
jgi:hypothetical protein